MGQKWLYESGEVWQLPSLWGWRPVQGESKALVEGC